MGVNCLPYNEREKEMTSLQLLWTDTKSGKELQYSGPLPITIGRGDENVIVVHSQPISRRHARLENRHGVLWLSDQNSTNGVYVNGRRVSEASLQKGESFIIGKVQFTIAKEPLLPSVLPRLRVYWPLGTTQADGEALVAQQGNELLITPQNKPQMHLQAGQSAQIGTGSLSMLPHLTVGAQSDRGKKRADRPNQDALALYSDLPQNKSQLLQKGMLFLVADGMGGAAGGQEASQMAIQTMLKEYYADPDSDIAHRLEHSIQAANMQIYQRGHTDPYLRGMGTTIVAAVILKNHLVVANVGDSRAYLLRQGQLKQLTTDHTLVQALLGIGIISPEEAATHPQRNVLIRDLGEKPTVQPDIQRETLQQGDILLLCSDGLWGVLKEQQIAQILWRQHGQAAARTLIDMANQHGGPDNISAIVVHVERLP